MTTLDELRRANLQEQRKKAEEAQAEPAPQPVEAPRTAAQGSAGAPARVPGSPTQSRPVAAAVELSHSPSVAAEPPPAKVDTAAVAVVVAEIAAADAEPPAPQPAHRNGNGHGPATSMEAVASPSVDVSVDSEDSGVDEADRKARAIMDRFYRGLAHKVVHPTGVKTTVDMPPDLFWRVKRYCHDHNNVTVRQLFLDMVIAVLEEEGY